MITIDYNSFFRRNNTMAVKIRLKRMGMKKHPFYRIVVADGRSPRDGRFIEEIGYYDPMKQPAEIKVKLYFVDKEPYEGITWVVEPKKVRCFRMNNVEHMCGFVVPLETQYAMKLESSQKIVVQYGRLDNRQTNLAYYTTLAY